MVFYNRKSLRLKDYDYSQEGCYFVTISTHHRKCLFGDVKNGEMVLNDLGRIVDDCWQWLIDHHEHVDGDLWVVMPNHLHGIIAINECGGYSQRGECSQRRGGSRTAPTSMETSIKRKPLGRLVGAFKTVSTKKINELCHTPGQILWQRNYFERIIRTDYELHQTRQYIQTNPETWKKTEENH